ncbi:MAG: PAS-domain containing protein [Hyphomicrobiaceae bacterium]
MTASEVSYEPRSGARLRLAVLATVAIAVVVVLTLTFIGEPMPRLGAFNLGGLAVVSALLGSILFFIAGAVALIFGYRRMRRRAQEQESALVQLQRRVMAAEAQLKTDVHALVVWEQGQPPRVAVHNLKRELGVPKILQEFLRFSMWLDPEGAHELAQGLDGLIKEARTFSRVLKTSAGAHVEVEGRVAGHRAILRLRDAAGARLELAKAEDALKRDRRDAELFRALAEGMPSPVWLRNQDGRIEWSNAAYSRVIGASREEAGQQRAPELLEARQQRIVETVLRSGRIYRDNVNVVLGGERRAFEVVSVPYAGASLTVATDVGALDAVRGELVRHREANDRTLDRVSTAVAVFGADQRLTFYNDAYAKLWRLDSAWLATHPLDGEILDRLREQRQLPEEADYRAWKARQLAVYGQKSEREDWWHLADGSTVHVVAEQRPDGGVTYLFDDVTEQLALESRHNAVVGAQRETLDHLKEGVAVFSTDGRLRLSNPAFARIWRLNPSDLERGPHIDEVIRRCRTLYDDEPTWTRLTRAVTTLAEERQRIEGQMARPDDSIIAYAGLPLPDGAMLLTFIDITDSKRFERVLVERNEALETAARLKSQFISHVSYELRTPLTNIIGFSELLTSPRTGDLNDKQREYLGDISASSKTLLSIINDILDLATIDAGGFELKLAPVQAAAIIDAAAQGVRERLNRAKLKLDVRIAHGVDSFVADENRVKQVLYNLLSNAIGFSEVGDTVTVVCEREGGMIAFTVRDQGAGIPEEHQRRVFERFESRTQGSKHRGAGLGLALVKSLVEIHGGDVTLVSAPGKGTEVRVRFPEAGVPVAPAQTASRRPAPLRAKPRRSDAA